MDLDFDIFAIAAPSGWTVLDPSSGATGSGPGTTAALSALRPKRGARVLVASDAVFSQSVRLSPAQTSGLTPEEIDSALFYEVEPFCGLTRESALIASTALAGGGGEWAVAVAAKTDVESLRTAVEAAHCRLAGVSQLPKATGADAPAAVMSQLFPEGCSAAPVIRAPRRAAFSPRMIAAAGAAIMVLCVALCLADWARLSFAELRLSPRLAASEEAAAANARIEAEIAAADRRVREIEVARERRARAMQELEGARNAWYSLFSTLAAKSGDDFAVVAIRPANDAIAELEAVSPSAAAAASVMDRLSAALAPYGWALRPGAVAERPGGLVAFSFRLGPTEEEAR